MNEQDARRTCPRVTVTLSHEGRVFLSEGATAWGLSFSRYVEALILRDAVARQRKLGRPAEGQRTYGKSVQGRPPKAPYDKEKDEE